MSGGLNKLGAAEIVRRIKQNETTAEAVMQDCLLRVEEREPEVSAFKTIDRDRALQAARIVDAGSVQGLLHGVPFAVKDIIDTVDYPTGWGSSIYDDCQSRRNASCVELFIRAGAIPIGKSVSTEFAYFQPGNTANPHNTGHTPGGSSSGSAAAVADFMAPLAFGSQTAGSLIRPASYCGIFGYKASHGVLSLDGIMGLAPSLDTLGVLTRNTEDIALARSVLCGSSAELTQDFSDTPPRVALMRGPHWAEGTIEMRDGCQRAMQALSEAGVATIELAHPAAFEELTECQKTVMAFEAARTRIFEYSQHRDQISTQFAELVESGLSVSISDYESALQTRAVASRQLETMFADIDVILTPAAPGEAPHGLNATGDPLYNRSWTILQVPCVSIPFGKGPNDLPLSVQLVGARGSDDKLLSAAGWIDDCLKASETP